MAIKPNKVTIEITKEACNQLRSFLMFDREGTGEGYSDFILKAINIRRMVADLEADYAAQVATLTADNARLRAAVTKLLAYVAGDVPLSEVEGIVAEMRRVVDNPTN